MLSYVDMFAPFFLTEGMYEYLESGLEPIMRTYFGIKSYRGESMPLDQ